MSSLNARFKLEFKKDINSPKTHYLCHGPNRHFEICRVELRWFRFRRLINPKEKDIVWVKVDPTFSISFGVWENYKRVTCSRSPDGRTMSLVHDPPSDNRAEYSCISSEEGYTQLRKGDEGGKILATWTVAGDGPGAVFIHDSDLEMTCVVYAALSHFGLMDEWFPPPQHADRPGPVGESIRRHEPIVARHHTTTISTTEFPNGRYVLHFKREEQGPESWTFVHDREQIVSIRVGHEILRGGTVVKTMNLIKCGHGYEGFVRVQEGFPPEIRLHLEDFTPPLLYRSGGNTKFVHRGVKYIIKFEEDVIEFWLNGVMTARVYTAESTGRRLEIDRYTISCPYLIYATCFFLGDIPSVEPTWGKLKALLTCGAWNIKRSCF